MIMMKITTAIITIIMMTTMVTATKTTMTTTTMTMMQMITTMVSLYLYSSRREDAAPCPAGGEFLDGSRDEIGPTPWWLFQSRVSARYVLAHLA
jgi:hypothetical protein